MCDDFIESSGGSRVIDRFTIPSGKQNADYWLEFGDAEMLVELKQVYKVAYEAVIKLLHRANKAREVKILRGPLQAQFKYHRIA